MRYSEFTEAHHQYDNPDYNTPFKPVKLGDTFTVYHGFRDRSDAEEAVTNGLSGAQRANRVYSPEFNHNPKGLFITLSRKIAEQFGDFIIEFDCSLDELEAPVWPGGSYTVQGQMSKYFRNGREGRVDRKKAGIDAENNMDAEIARRPELEHIKQSDKKYLAYMLTNSTEYQALYIGHLDPARIKAVYVKDDPRRSISTLSKLSRDEFIQKFPQNKEKVRGRSKLFQPHEDFSGDLFYERIQVEYPKKLVPDLDETLARLWGDVRKSERPMNSFMSYFGQWFYPKQIPVAFNWFKRTFKNAEADK
jgi:hypothetical protein